jgi:PAS domain S-box-containing protein
MLQPGTEGTKPRGLAWPVEPDGGADFHTLFEDAPVAYHEIDTEGTVLRVNRAECELLGFSESEMLGEPIWKFVAPDGQEESRAAISRKIHTPEPLNPFERTYVTRDGSTVIVQIHERRIRDLDGNAIGMRSAMLDITGRKRSDDALARSNAELEQSACVASHDLQELMRMRPGDRRIHCIRVGRRNPHATPDQ